MPIIGTRSKQQQAVYDAEHALSLSSEDNFATLDACRAWCDSLTSSKWWEWEHVVRVEVQRSKSTIYSMGKYDEDSACGLIGLTKFGQNKATILHEIAHTVAGSDAGHGPVWVATHLQLTLLARGERAFRELISSYMEHGVDIGFDYDE